MDLEETPIPEKPKKARKPRVKKTVQSENPVSEEVVLENVENGPLPQEKPKVTKKRGKKETTLEETKSDEIKPAEKKERKTRTRAS